ncbi:MAG: hypothetical protein NTZ59_13500 [Bacteroidetes bacterium]|nr:hypothetical protein [Bacteroidota bacterium]
MKIIDTVLLPQKTDKDHFTWARELLADAIKVTEESIDNCITNSVHTRRKSFSDATFNNIYSKDIYQKLLFDKSTKIGIYKTYADFLNKTPSTDSFNIEFDRFKNVGYHHLFIKESENYLLNRSAWGVYDGNNLWINSNGYLSVLYLRDGLYYWLGIESAEEHSLAFNPNGINQSPIASVGINDNFYWKKAVHFLDTITGKKAW